MATAIIKVRQLGVTALLLLIFLVKGNAQYKDFMLSPKGDTLNIVDKKGLKQGKWVNTVGEVRGEPGYEEEGMYKNDKKTGPWRKYNSNGDIIAIENYLHGGKAGVQQYFTFLGVLEREEEWRAYNPDAPYDTIAVYGTGSNEVIDYKIVKAEQYSVPQGEWKYYNPSGHIVKIEHYDRGQLLKDAPQEKPVTASAEEKPKEKEKPQEVMDYEKKYSKKKKKQMERMGKTSL
jgi:antitoxin component YwqK of YwqJK toxin-antitoxin module